MTLQRADASLSLPRGPHRLGRDEVASSQRTRLLQAMTSVVAAEGYRATTIREVARRAGVSLATFYEHHRDKDDCFLVAYEAVVAELFAVIGATIGQAVTPSDALRLGIEAYFDWFDQHRDAALTFLQEIHCAGRAALERRRVTLDRFEEFIGALAEDARRLDPSLPEVDRRVLRAIVRNLDALAAEQLRPGRELGFAEAAREAVHVAAILLAGHEAAAAAHLDAESAPTPRRTRR